MTVLDQVLGWSEQRGEPWLRDALRRLVVQDALSKEDREQLFELFEYESGLREEPATVEPIPLVAKHLPNRMPSAEPLSITRIGPVTGVNALAPNQAISLEPLGVNVIYGRNASGKSGYSRVLKKACRARDCDERVLGNVFSTTPQGKQQAEFEVKTGESKETIVWTPEAVPDQTAGVAVFDARCARLYVDKAGEIAFLPYGLDVFPELCELMDEFSERLNKQMLGIRSNLATLPDLPERTVAREFVDKLSANTTDVEIASACGSDEQSMKRLEELRALLAKNPEGEAKKLQRLATRLRTLQQATGGLKELVVGTNPKVTALLASRAVAQQAVKQASELAFRDCPLPGVGSDPWRFLFKAAEQYSVSEAYEGEDYPVLDDDARCVLCQQLLNPGAKERFTAFKEFVSGSAEKTLLDAEKAVTNCSTDLSSYLRSIAEIDDALLDEIAEVDEPLKGALAGLRTECEQTLSRKPSGLEDLNVVAIANLAASVPDTVETAVKLEQAAGELLKGVDGDEKLRTSQEVANLEASKLLAANKAAVGERRKQLKALASLQSARDSLNTSSVTRAGTKIAEASVTSELRRAMTRAFDDLGLPDIPIEIKREGGKGSFLTCLTLGGGALKAPLSDVLSEGEQRVIALAAFMAEISLEDHRNALVFDDPVSSLDHNHREHVAKSIVELAKDRQLIIFTHDIVFLHDLGTNATEMGVDFVVRALRRESRELTGLCEPDAVPPELLPLPGHIEALDAKRVELKNEYERSRESSCYRDGVRRWYGLLREAWEKSVEEALFNQVVRAYADDVKTLSLREVAVDDEDWEAVRSGIARASAQLQGHRKSAARNSPIPSPRGLLDDLRALQDFVKRVKNRRKELKQRRPK